MNDIIGRKDEKKVLASLLNSNTSQLVAIYGRRRVGKTFLVRHLFEKEMLFEASAIHNAPLQEQLNYFNDILNACSKKKKPAPVSWHEVFARLQVFLAAKISARGKKVIFFDEFPWFDTPRSGFLRAFEQFWNTWASRQNKLMVVICGSAASWMIKKIVNNRGGLHNRVTARIRLQPFTLAETEALLQSKNIVLDRYQVLQLYMAMGGIPQYLTEIKKGESAMQAIDRICFSKEGLLSTEFKNLYASLFDDTSYHIAIVNALAKKPSGLTRNEIIRSCKITSGGTVTKIIEELSESGFITQYTPFGKALKDSIYKLTDEYSLFYLKYVKNNSTAGKGTWLKLSTGNSWKSWSGYAFESICMRHIQQIKRALGIEAVHTEISAWRDTAKSEENSGAQIDLLIDRQDRCINICEMKFSGTGFELTKNYVQVLKNKMTCFQNNTRTRKALLLTFITTFKVRNNRNYTGFIQNEITMNALFEAS